MCLPHPPLPHPPRPPAFFARRQRISLYAHITGLAFDYNSLDQQVTQASIADADDGAIRSVPIDHSRPAYEVANMLWDNMDTPQLPH